MIYEAFLLLTKIYFIVFVIAVWSVWSSKKK